MVAVQLISIIDSISCLKDRPGKIRADPFYSSLFLTAGIKVFKEFFESPGSSLSGNVESLLKKRQFIAQDIVFIKSTNPTDNYPQDIFSFAPLPIFTFSHFLICPFSHFLHLIPPLKTQPYNFLYFL